MCIRDRFKASLSAAFAKNPWLTNFPAFFEKVIPVYEDEKWFLVDETGHSIPMKTKDLMGWKMLAESGGEHIKVFGEWQEGKFFPMSWKKN